MTSAATDVLARERNRRLTAGIITSVVSRGTGALAPLILIPITLSYLGDQLYGLWMAVTAVTGMALWADLGLGNGLMTRLAPYYASGDTAAARRYISTTYGVLSVVALGLLAGLWALSGVISWTSTFNVTDPAVEAEARAVALVCLSAFVVNIPLSLVQRVQYAYQQVVQSNLWQATGSLWTVLLTLVAVEARLSPALVVGAAVSGPPLANLLNSAWLYGRQCRLLAPRPTRVDRTVARSLLLLGGQFFGLSIAMSIAVNADNLVIAHALGLEAVTDYSVPARLFSALGLLVTVVNLPFWSANGEALARGDLGWVRRVTGRMTLASGLVVLLSSAILVLAGGHILEGWLGAPRPVPVSLLVALGAWWLLLATASPRFMVQNAAGSVRPQLVGWTVFLAVSLPLKWIAARQLGIAAVPAAGAAIYLLTVWPAAENGFRRIVSAPGSPVPEEA